MEYVRLTGEGGAFGWQSAQDGVWRLTLGGCAAGECLVIGEAGAEDYAGRRRGFSRGYGIRTRAVRGGAARGRIACL